MVRQKSSKGRKKPKTSPQSKQIPATTPPPTTPCDSLPDLPNYDSEPTDGVRVGESPMAGLTLKRILRGHTGHINRIAWSPDGRLLASPSEDKTISIWDVAIGKCMGILRGHEDDVYSVAWSPDSNFIASASKDATLRLWNIPEIHEVWKITLSSEEFYAVAFSTDGSKIAYADENELSISDARNGQIYFAINQAADLTFGNMHGPLELAWSPNDHLLACGLGGPPGEDIRVFFINPTTGEVLFFIDTKDSSYGLDWHPTGKFLAIGGGEGKVYICDLQTRQIKTILEGHTDTIESLRFSSDGSLLATKAHDGTIRIWRCDTWDTIAIIYEKSSESYIHGIAFHPLLSLLATLGEQDTVIRIWDIDMNVLLGQTSVDSVRYTTAKCVLVGDSGVGKTGLGWRLAHGEFKEHASTHGQQFWVIDKLGTKRKDGTECEAVLWDLAGQHVYRSIHSIFLDNVDASLVLFDPSNRQDPLKGAQFWLEQLKGKGQLPPSMLVGARVDVSSPVLSQQEYDQFCQRYGISGGYISTSAKRGDGLDVLMDRLKAQIQWDKMTTTVTTVTFKRIKDYVLTLKEKPDREGVLVRPAELRPQLQVTDPDWKFTDAEMMTAIGHLQTHGYVTILKSSSGETYILLTPDLLVNLASSIVLLADKHPRELGAVSETELLSGRYPFNELAGLDEAERQILLDAAALRFLEHNICFRETFDNDTLLIFPGLIKQRRPLEDAFSAADDISYMVRGRIENLYSMLVVLLGYTPSFSRINQWQNQAQYEMGKGEICGFRLIEDREGEIELLLYYSEKMPQRGRASFQELFERFLYQREVEVTRFPPVVCPKGHRLDRTTVVRLIREGKILAFCAECGGKVDLPKLDKPGIGTSVWLQREEAAARLRSTYEAHLSRVKGYRRGWATPRCYLSRVPGQEDCAAKIIHDLKDAGVYIVEDAAQVLPDDYIVVLDTPDYQRIWRNPTQEFAVEVKLVKDRMTGGKRRLISIVLEGKSCSATQHDLGSCTPGNFCDATHYPVSLFDLMLELYAIPFTHAGFVLLRDSLHQQWEQTLAGMKEIIPESGKRETRKRFDVALSFPGEHRNLVKTVADILAKQLDRERVFFCDYYEAELARTDLDTYLQEIYHDQTELVVVFLCAEYKQKEWCGLELRAVRDMLKQKKTTEIMFLRLDNTDIPGLFSIDGYIDAKGRKPAELADLIVQRLTLNRKVIS
ncbi:MAG: TIR domain-containing protein [Candidatus Methanoperedens sp.]